MPLDVPKQADGAPAPPLGSFAGSTTAATGFSRDLTWGDTTRFLQKGKIQFQFA